MHGFTVQEIRSELTSDLNKICGIINSSDSNRFQKVAFRITKGNCWVALTEASSLPKQGQHRRSVFVLVFPGNRNGSIYNKISRMCESFNASRFQFPQNRQDYGLKIQQIQAHITESKQIISLTKKNLTDFLRNFTNEKYDIGFSYIEFLKHYVNKEKAIYTTLNNLKPSGSVYAGFFWIPSDQFDVAEKCLNDLAKRYLNLPSSTLKIIETNNITPPTYFKSNEFKLMFQTIVNTYGIPTYKEVNPGIFVIAGFPFLFGVMFGDIGHGSLLFIFGLYLLIFKEDILANKDSIFRPVVPARYLVTLMGFFALYCGLIYNDFLSLQLNLFGSCYQVEENSIQAIPTGCVYPFGIDPIWGRASNDLTSVNSFKMKLAVIIGVAQMCLGILMKAFNAVYFRKWIDFFFEFIPQILFMGLLFGYMDYLIFAKWATNYHVEIFQYKDKIPSIITTLIDMALKVGGIQEQNGSIIENQETIQTIIIVIAVLCVPMMLIPKPLILRYQMSKLKQGSQHRLDSSSDLLIKSQLGDDDLADLARDLEQAQFGEIIPDKGENNEDFEEVLVHQIIETIEFVLGSISNTASYLRLWALSLAHSQLAQVFFQKGIQSGLEQGNIPLLICGYFIFAFVTIGVLLAMDVMECFLHALRLQWVEFQNKFYKAEGFLFCPLSFQKCIDEQIPNEEEEIEKAKSAKRKSMQ